ncbi:ABC transporter ATP-binding protein [Prauserella muralis]|uniref:ABC transporter ATP-binding protein n=1 Tax=Prauserella muralis TaxID=588067 RepID=A0A2V4B8L8_9PSEU|nr:ABC transporter ATP-binding protein [Prauserella muralis]PXY31608.1 ABC transporter ATP-binding protein [Prauserella muralis]TWE14029.1 putative ABC transport system ATP-binding protein [Prauserella muralis]
MHPQTTDRPGQLTAAAPALAGRNLVKRYGAQYALAGVDIDIQPGEAVAIVGPSGSGKTSLLHVLAGILKADSGEVLLAGRRIDQLGETKRSELRRTEFGFVFQSGMLVAELSAEENAALPMLLAGAARGEALGRAREWLGRLGLSGKERNRPGELSGGEAQRVAIARALAHRPSVIFADEPTGALDTRTGRDTMDALLGAAGEHGAAVVIVTHDRDLADSVPRTVAIRDGRIDTAGGTA